MIDRIEVIQVRGRRLGDVRVAVCHEDPAELLARLGPAVLRAPNAESFVICPPNEAVDA
jgi:hypothetical protein